MDTRPPKLGRSRDHFQYGDFRLLHGQRGQGDRNCGFPSDIVGTLHVRHLSHDQLQGHQLLPEDGTWCSVGRHSIFHLWGGGLGAIGYGRHQRRLRWPKIWFYLGTGFAGLLFVGLLFNWIFNPAGSLLQSLDRTEYDVIPE